MANPYIGEIRMFADNFAPAGWAFSDGQLLSIAQNDALFYLIGTTYGGDGETTFALPDLRGRFPFHYGNGFVIGQQGGNEKVTLTASYLTSHTHLAKAGNSGTYNAPQGNLWANWTGAQYANGTDDLILMSPQALTPAGGNQPHENRPPFLAVNFIISLGGFFPSTP